ncbi:MAG: ribosome silencing factor [Spirochaetaceae bacterium]|jgi:ribosome-associated protein|nr:ribosome silencing factor [Spirochaetaceae bacterium]
MEDLTNRALELGRLLAEHKGLDVLVVDMRPLFFWTDFFVIATVTSGAHRAGLEKRAREWASGAGISHSSGGKKTKDDTWSLIDMGNIVAHLMTKEAREFYELENLWCGGTIIRP